jgi:hypothetical protein
MLIVKSRQRWVAVTLWSTFGFGIMTWLVMRRSGFTTSYIRCHYNSMNGDFRQLLQAGTTPANVFLPPHLRLDQISYLDHPDTELAVPPTIDVGLQEDKHIQSLEGNMPKSERTDIHGHIGPFKTHSIIVSPNSADRYIKRRLGPSEAHVAQMEKEKAEKEAAL